MKKEKTRKPAEGEAEKKEGAKAEGEGFRHRIRVSGVILDGVKEVNQALTNIKGIGRRISPLITRKLDIKKGTKLGSLTDEEIEKIEKTISDLGKHAPSYMLNRKRDSVSGESMHLIGPELEMGLREDVTKQKKIKSYRGVRHSLGLPVRGQRTRSSFRFGPSLGVSRKKVLQQPKKKE